MNRVSFRGDVDRARMLALARLRPGDNVHVIDLPYRLCSWALDCPDAVALWEADGELMAWAVLQTPAWKLDYALHPAAPPDTHAAVLAWAVTQAPRLPAAFARPAWYVAVPADQAGRRADLLAAGFADQSEAAEPWSQVLLRRDGREPAPRVALRPGFAIRPLRGQAEVPTYVALHREVFGTDNMTEAWRRATLRAPGYRPAFDLLATDPAGEPVGFAVAWWHDGMDGPVAQIEPFGVRREARRYGIAWALMSELLARVGEAGAAAVWVGTDRQRDRAMALYQGFDFRVVRDVITYRKAL